MLKLDYRKESSTDLNKEKKKCAEYSHDLFREIALIKLLINKNDFVSKDISHSLSKKNLLQKYFLYLNSNEIWILLSIKTNCGNTFLQCIDQTKENLIGFHPLDGECYTKFKNILWPCIMDYYQIDLHTLPNLSRYNNYDYINKCSINYSTSQIKLFSIIAIRNLNDYSFESSLNNNQIELLISEMIKDMIDKYQGQYITRENFNEKHLKILTNSMIHFTDKYPCSLYISSDESVFIWLMGSDHFRFVSLSSTMNIRYVYTNLYNYLIFIENYLLKKNSSFAFHPKFGYLTSSIEELSGLFILIHCTIINEDHRKWLENQLEKVNEHLSYSRYSLEPSTMIIRNRPLLGLNDNEKLLRTIHSILFIYNRTI